MIITNTRQLKIKATNKKPVWDDTFQRMSWWDTEKVQQAKVMVVGAGALGNEVLKNLALMNVGHIIIVDFDQIEYHNLCRSVLFRPADCEARRLKAEVAAQRIREINPTIKTAVINGDILIDVGLGLIQSMDVIIGCLDNRLARLAINQKCFKINQTWIDGAIENLAGQINVHSKDSSCYECQLQETEIENIRTKLGCPDIARRNTAQGRVPTTPISASIIGAMQVQEALKIIHNNDKQSLKGEKFVYEGMNVVTLRYDVASSREECTSHVDYNNIIISEELSADTSIKATLDWLKHHFKEEEVAIYLDHELVLELTTATNEHSHTVIKAKPHLSDEFIGNFQEIPGEDVFITESTFIINDHFPQRQLSLKAIGVPYWDILKIKTKDNFYYVELAKDAQLFKW